MNQYKKINCKNCGTHLTGSFCHNCGQQHMAERWSTSLLMRKFIHQISDVEKGFLHTIKGLFIFPGKLIQDYWKGKTIIYYNPFRYVLIWAAINLLINFWLGIDDLLQDYFQPNIVEENFSETEIASADQQFDSWLNILVLLLIPVRSIISKWLFKKQGQNYAEHIILNTYILGQQSLISSFTQFVFYFFPTLVAVYLMLNLLVGIFYDAYVFNKTFYGKWWNNLGKAFIVSLIGVVVYFMLVALFSAVAFALT